MWAGPPHVPHAHVTRREALTRAATTGGISAVCNHDGGHRMPSGRRRYVDHGVHHGHRVAHGQTARVHVRAATGRMPPSPACQPVGPVQHGTRILTHAALNQLVHQLFTALHHGFIQARRGAVSYSEGHRQQVRQPPRRRQATLAALVSPLAHQCIKRISIIVQSPVYPAQKALLWKSEGQRSRPARAVCKTLHLAPLTHVVHVCCARYKKSKLCVRNLPCTKKIQTLRDPHKPVV
jgi:hypothetical protein